MPQGPGMKAVTAWILGSECTCSVLNRWKAKFSTIESPTGVADPRGMKRASCNCPLFYLTYIFVSCQGTENRKPKKPSPPKPSPAADLPARKQPSPQSLVHSPESLVPVP